MIFFRFFFSFFVAFVLFGLFFYYAVEFDANETQEWFLQQTKWAINQLLDWFMSNWFHIENYFPTL